MTPADILRAAVREDPGRPYLTHYDDALGSRVELSYATFDNWVAKTANLLVDEFGTDPGDHVVLALPAHWQTAAWLFACWSAGLVARPLGDDVTEIPSDPEIRVIAADAGRLGAALDAGAEDVVALSLHPLGAPYDGLPAGAVDYATEVRGHGDQFVTYARPDPNRPALIARNQTVTGGELAEAARTTAESFGLTAKDHVYAEVSMAEYADIVDALLAPMAAGGSVVIGTNTDAATLNGRFSAERISSTIGQVAGSPPVRRLR